MVGKEGVQIDDGEEPVGNEGWIRLLNHAPRGVIFHLNYRYGHRFLTAVLSQAKAWSHGAFWL
uniref:Uncharacterized protein n=1 Tax=Kalanchoe fedtschenkoi TaxID=63787 RepID=A0A7N0TNF4_KALFE